MDYVSNSPVGRECSESWLVARVMPQKERVVADNLRELGYDVLVPMITVRRTVRRRGAQRRRSTAIIKVQPTPLFPSYLFVNVRSGDGYVGLYRHPMVGGFLCRDSVALKLPENEVRRIKTLCSDEGVTERRAEIVVGARVEIVIDGFSGLRGGVVTIRRGDVELELDDYPGQTLWTPADACEEIQNAA